MPLVRGISRIGFNYSRQNSKEKIDSYVVPVKNNSDTLSPSNGSQGLIFSVYTKDQTFKIRELASHEDPDVMVIAPWKRFGVRFLGFSALVSIFITLWSTVIQLQTLVIFSDARKMAPWRLHLAWVTIFGDLLVFCKYQFTLACVSIGSISFREVKTNRTNSTSSGNGNCSTS